MGSGRGLGGFWRGLGGVVLTCALSLSVGSSSNPCELTCMAWAGWVGSGRGLGGSGWRGAHLCPVSLCRLELEPVRADLHGARLPLRLQLRVRDGRHALRSGRGRGRGRGRRQYLRSGRLHGRQ